MENIFIWTIKKPLNFMLYLFDIWLSQLTWPITFCNLTHIITGIFSNMQWEGGRGVCCCYETKTPIVWCILTTDFISPPFHELNICDNIVIIITYISCLLFSLFDIVVIWWWCEFMYTFVGGFISKLLTQLEITLWETSEAFRRMKKVIEKLLLQFKVL